MNNRRTFSSVPVFFIIFTLSGFSGLIYESIWSHYLKLFLGHAAYAQALVLAIFMGGMAAGSAFAAKFSKRIRNTLLAYALVEAVIGLIAIVFHNAFLGATEWAFRDVIGSLNSPQSIEIFKWALASLLILPQSILLGATFPLMSSGLIRRNPKIAGYSLSMLYFTNSLGASLGVLASGFILIRLVGLPGTVLTAGLLNLLVAAFVWLIAKNESEPNPTTDIEFIQGNNATGNARKHYPYTAALLVATFFSSAASFFYEIGWIRMLSMVLGSATHSFELMLSAFILGLAIGGFVIRNKADSLKQPLLALAAIQIGMGLLATLTVPMYNFTFDLMAWGMRGIARTENGYVLINLFNHGIAMLVMLPATICAGMTLPLVTRILLSQGAGEESIGKVYSLNTVGAIFGVLLASLVIMPTFGLRNVVLLGAAGDVIVGIGLLLLAYKTYTSTQTNYGKRFQAITFSLGGTAVISFVLVAMTVEFDPIKLASGIYRLGTLDRVLNRTPLNHLDGATASIDVFKVEDTLSIATNGKVDASIGMENIPSADEATMVMAAVLPLLYNPAAESAAVIGFGSGYTSHALLGSPTIKQVDTIEIEPKMVEGARAFEQSLPRVFSDPRSHIYINDAKTYFSSHQKTYDIIIAEPSNPWVSGVSSLFSIEFYKRITNHLTHDGVYVQWIQAYEINLELIGTILAALQQEFNDIQVYTVGSSDLILVAKKNDKLPPLNFEVFKQPEILKSLKRTGLETPYDIEISHLAGINTLKSLQIALNQTANSDYYPILDLGAGKARFLQQDALEFLRLRSMGFLLLEMLDNLTLNYPISTPQFDQSAFSQAKIAVSGLLYQFEKKDQNPNLTTIQAQTIRNVLNLQEPCNLNLLEKGWLPDLHKSMQAGLATTRKGTLTPLIENLSGQACINKAGSSIKDWLTFYMAIDQRNYESIVSAAKKILDSNQHLHKVDRDFIQFNGTVAAVAINSPELVKQFWGARFRRHHKIEVENHLLDVTLISKGF